MSLNNNEYGNDLKNKGEKVGFQNLKMNHMNQQSIDVLLGGNEMMEDNYRY